MIRAALLLALLAACTPPRTHAAAPTAAAPPPTLPGLQMRGVALGLWDFASEGAPGAYSFDRQLDDVRALGADHVLLVVHWRQHDARSSALAPAEGATIPDATLQRVVRAAHARGLHVLLFPVVDLEVIRAGEWRGTLAPADLDAWWSAYRAFVLHYAQLAADEQVEWLSLGSELGSTEHWRDRWYALISSVQQRYHGALTYSANWDHYREVSFWDRLDAIGVSAYPQLATDGDASAADMTRAWAGARAELAGFANVAGKPLVLTEMGVASRDGAAEAPWDYTRGGGVDVEEQRRAYQAFSDGWDGEPALAGVFVWVWWGAGGERDAGYTPRGKPAERELRRLFSARGAGRN